MSSRRGRPEEATAAMTASNIVASRRPSHSAAHAMSSAALAVCECFAGAHRLYSRVTEIGRDGFDLRLGQAVRDRRHDAEFELVSPRSLAQFVNWLTT